MRIGIDISQIVYKTGVSFYTENLVKNLLAKDRTNEYVLFGCSLRLRARLESFAGSLEGNFKSKFFSIPPLVTEPLFNRARLPIEAFTGPLDVFHSSDWTKPKTRAFQVATVHDLSPIIFEKYTDPRIVRTHKKVLALVKKEVDRVIVPSIATKKDLVDFGVKAEAIRVIPEAPSVTPGKVSAKKIKEKYALKSGYLISIGVGERKNTKGIITAFNHFNQEEGGNFKLVIIGRGGPDKGPKNTLFLGHLDTHEVKTLLAGAEALVYPSFYEGFGLPILDAMVLGVPVVTSKRSSMKEVAGEAAVLVDPEDSNSILAGIKSALQNKKSLVSKGKKRVKDYSWEKTAEMTLAVYQEAVKPAK